MNRRAFFQKAALAAAALAVDPERLLWTPTKTIFVPPVRNGAWDIRGNNDCCDLQWWGPIYGTLTYSADDTFTISRDENSWSTFEGHEVRPTKITHYFYESEARLAAL